MKNKIAVLFLFISSISAFADNSDPVFTKKINDYKFTVFSKTADVKNGDGTDIPCEVQTLQIENGKNSLSFDLFEVISNGYVAFLVEDISMEDVIGDKKIEIILTGSEDRMHGFHGGSYQAKRFLNFDDDSAHYIFQMMTGVMNDVGYSKKEYYDIRDNKINVLEIYTDTSSDSVWFNEYYSWDYIWDNDKYVLTGERKSVSAEAENKNIEIYTLPDKDSDLFPVTITADSTVYIEERSAEKEKIDGDYDFWYRISIVERSAVTLWNPEIILDEGWVFGTDLIIK